MKATIFVLALLCLYLPASPQGLQPGDTLPPVTLTGLHNYPANSARTRDFADRLLILDFWASWCGTCIKFFPKMDSFQTRFHGKLQVILVNSLSTGDDSLKIDSFFKRRRSPRGEPYSFPHLVQDTVLSRLFPHTSIPHYVWIMGNRVVAITSWRALTATNILNLIQRL